MVKCEKKKVRSDRLRKREKRVKIVKLICHPGLSGILLKERFPTSGNDRYRSTMHALELAVIGMKKQANK